MAEKSKILTWARLTEIKNKALSFKSQLGGQESVFDAVLEQAAFIEDHLRPVVRDASTMYAYRHDSQMVKEKAEHILIEGGY